MKIQLILHVYYNKCNIKHRSTEAKCKFFLDDKRTDSMSGLTCDHTLTLPAFICGKGEHDTFTFRIIHVQRYVQKPDSVFSLIG